MIRTIEEEDLECLDRMEIEPKQEDIEYLDMGDMDIMEDMGEVMGTKTGGTGGKGGVSSQKPRPDGGKIKGEGRGRGTPGG